MQTWHLHITGQVQGVGFRPFVYRLALAHNLRGWVNNTLDGVHIRFNSGSAEAEAFQLAILTELPVIARVINAKLSECPAEDFPDFRILHSSDKGIATLLLSPDFGICPSCRQEILQAGNRRHNYAFTTCTYCGPRFSIITDLPYDRPRTAMLDFDLCPHCAAEYRDPIDRRYYAQTNSCPTCAITLSLYDQEGKQLPGNQVDLLEHVVNYWQRGKIVALKGIGGYLLTCAADQPDVIEKLRARKHRPTKPLAVMFPSPESLTTSTYGNTEVLKILAGPVAPIAILPIREGSDQLALDQLAPGLRKLGCMLPYTPLYTLLLARYGKAIVATSGNRSGQPIIYTDQQALTDLTLLADYVLTNDRPIVVPQDDSVIQWSPVHGQKIILRRARGLAPTILHSYCWRTDQVLAAGADIKSSFALLHQGQCYQSPYLGDLTDWTTQENYRRLRHHLVKVLHAQPTTVLVDAHPNYAATSLGQEYAQVHELNKQVVPHHEAHFAAVLAEHELTACAEPILGIIWDGTGWGGDGQIWGGELFEYQSGQFQRIGQVEYFSSSLGDKMAYEPRLCAWSLLHAANMTTEPIANQFTDKAYRFYRQFFARTPKRYTSSMGRLFDGVTALLGLKSIQSHEAEAAMLLEARAQAYMDQEGGAIQLRDYLAEYPFSLRLALQPILRGILEEQGQGVAVGASAANFHYTLVAWVRKVAVEKGYRHLAFSGGVFQNALLVDMLIQQLGQNFALYFHEKLSPNDENIGFGQLVWYDLRQAHRSRPPTLENSLASH